MKQAPKVMLCGRRVGERRPTIGVGERIFFIADIGINHNGSLDLAKQLIDGAVLAGCDAVKFQKRTPELCVPKHSWDLKRETPWGVISYIDYRHRIEFGRREYEEIHRHCREKGILWLASCWDEPSVEFIEAFEPPCYKAASASLTDLPLLEAMRKTGRPLIISTGMSTMEEIDAAVAVLGRKDLCIAHATSTYPCSLDQLNLRMLDTLKRRYPDCPIGYSGHETGLPTTWAAAALGATFIERHITLDRAMWGSDQAASVEIGGLRRLVENIHNIERALGDGTKRVYSEELKMARKLRRVPSDPGPLDG